MMLHMLVWNVLVGLPLAVCPLGNQRVSRLGDPILYSANFSGILLLKLLFSASLCMKLFIFIFII